MNTLLPEFLLWASEFVIICLTGAVGKLWLAHMKFREEVAMYYARKSELELLFSKNSTDLSVVKDTVERILGMVHEIKGSLHGITRE